MTDLSKSIENNDLSVPGLEYSPETLALVREFLPVILGKPTLNSIQDAIFCQCWRGATYRDIAHTLGYDSSYVRLMGAQLWKLLSEKLGQKVTKSNFQPLLINRVNHFRRSSSILPTADDAMLDHDSKVKELNFDSYIERGQIEAQCYETIMQDGALIRIKAPREMGKTMLMSKILNHAKKNQLDPVALSLRLADTDTFVGLDRFLQWFCLNIGDQLNLGNQLHTVWENCFSSSYNCTHYVEKIILPSIDHAVVIALDDVDVLFQYPKIATDFFGMLRAWSEKAKHVNASSYVWRRCRLLVIHSTDVYIPLNKHQSPFNVGLSIELPEFTVSQVTRLASKFKLTFNDLDLRQIMELVGGKPRLLSLIFSAMLHQQTALTHILQAPMSPTSLFSEHLRSLYRKLQYYPELQLSFEQVVFAEESIAIAPLHGFQLESLGLITLESGMLARPSCNLYRQYFRQLLKRT